MAGSPKQAHAATSYKAYASALAAQGWCVDQSGFRAALLHIRSGRSKTLDSLPLDYLEWVRANGMEVGDGSYADILQHASIRISQSLPRVAGSTFRPVDQPVVDEDGIKLANTFQPYAPERLDPGSHAAGEAMVEAYFERLFPVTAERMWVRQYLAHILKYPLVRPQMALLVTGEPGTGKSLMAQCIEIALGDRHWWRENDFSAAFKPFSQVLTDHLVVTFDDAPVKGSTEEQLKFAITRSRQEIEVKGQQQRIKREVYSRIIVLTNDRNPFALQGDRRYYLPQHCVHRVNKQESDSFFAQFVPWLNGKDAGPVIYHWLMETSLEGFSELAPPLTETKRRLVAGADDLAEAIRVYVMDDKIVHSKEIEILAAQMGQALPSAVEIAEAMARADYAHRRRGHPTKNGQIWLWVPQRTRRTRALFPHEIERLQRAGALN